VLERKQDLGKDAAAGTPKEPAQVGVGSEGFYARSADGSFQFRIRGYLQFDGRFFEATEALPAQDTWLLRRVRPVFEGTVFRYFDYKIMPDFGGGTTTLVDGYIDARALDALRIRGGKYKAPFGLERLQSARDLMFVERGLTVNLTPFRDTGVAVWGEPLGGVLSYMAGLFNGAPDGQSADSSSSHSMTADARIFAVPFKRSSSAALKGLGIGYAATYGRMHGVLGSTGLGIFKTAGQRTFFSYRVAATADGTALADGLLVRLNPEAYYYYGRLGVQAEVISERQEVALGASRATLRNSSWRLEASLLLTDDTASFTGVDPKRPFARNAHGPGAFEVAARVGQLSVDGEAFPTFANPDVAARQANEFALGLNWYLNRNVKVQVNGSKTWFEGGAPAGDRDDENVLETCFQLAF
jgi:phosphate-selective porin OprO/OprP